MNELTHTVTDSPIGELTLVASGGRLCGVYFPHHWHPPQAIGVRTDRGFDEAIEQVAQYLAGDRHTFELRTDVDGDDLQRRVWARLDAIEYGSTVSYSEIAADLGANARVVGQAVGRNPLSIVVPCHRVVGKDGSLTGYAGGLARKRFLLDLEQVQHARLF